jgi:hypothetical protein
VPDGACRCWLQFDQLATAAAGAYNDVAGVFFREGGPRDDAQQADLAAGGVWAIALPSMHPLSW